MGAGQDKNMLAPSTILSTIRTRFLAKAPPRCPRLLPTRRRLCLGALHLGMAACTMNSQFQFQRLLRFFFLASFFNAF